MAIVRWEPFDELDRFFDGFPIRSVQNMGWDIAVDIFDEGNSIVASMNLPGIDPDKVDVHVEGDHLRISGRREEEKEQKGKQYYAKEIRRGSFERAIRLPGAVNDSAVKAEYEGGVLKVTMPKLDEKKRKKVKVVKKGK